MESLQIGIWSDFFGKASTDGRISISHIGLYAVLFQLWKQQGFEEKITFYSWEIMPVARLSSPATYHKLIRDLAEFGYINYLPSLYKGKRSTVQLSKTNKNPKLFSEV